MAVKFKVFASGRLADSTLQRPVNALYELYRVPMGKTAVIDAIRLVNTYSGAVPVTMVLCHSNIGEIPFQRPLFPRDLLLGKDLMLIEDRELTLGSDDAIWAKVGKDGDSNNQNYMDKIDFVITGVERDV